jgi:hypothetical protein
MLDHGIVPAEMLDSDNLVVVNNWLHRLSITAAVWLSLRQMHRRLH